MLSEGLIKVPLRLLKLIQDKAAQYFLWMLRDRFTPTLKKDLPEHWAAVRKAIATRGIKLPREKFKVPADGYDAYRYPIDLSGLPGSNEHNKGYDDLAPKNENFLLVMNHGKLPPGDSQASFYPCQEWQRPSSCHQHSQCSKPRPLSVKTI